MYDVQETSVGDMTPKATRAWVPADYRGATGGDDPHQWQPLAWETVHDRLVRARDYWVATVQEGQLPHSRPVWGVWQDTAFTFSVGRATRTARNLAANPSVSMHPGDGHDVVLVEGQVAPATASDEIERFVDARSAKYEMPPPDVQTDDSSPWVVYTLHPHTVLAWTLGEFPHDITRFRLEPDPSTPSRP
jgi:nitroimidazol reductase NimA-like FMN-containing flavoprotein (pyridoxamine 5'-phosphate oxidase superfamily)